MKKKTTIMSNWHVLLMFIIVLLFIGAVWWSMSVIKKDSSSLELPKLGQDNPPYINDIARVIPAVCGNNICEIGEYNGSIILCPSDCWVGLNS